MEEFQSFFQTFMSAAELKIETVCSKFLTLIVNNLHLFNQAWVTNNSSLIEVPLHVIKQIMEHQDGKLSWKTKTFNLWFSANEESLSDQEKMEALRYFKDIFSDSIEEEKDGSS